jgi:hypothetical protein
MEKGLDAGRIQVRDRAKIDNDSWLVRTQDVLHFPTKSGHFTPAKPCRKGLNYDR